MSFEWERLQLRELGRIVTGKTPSTARIDFFGGNIPFLTPTDMVDGQKTVRASRSLTDAGLATVKNCLVSRGVSVSCIGWQMGKSVLVLEPTVTNQQINTVVVDESRFNLSFVYYLLASMRDQIFELGATPTRTPIVNKSTFGQITVFVPGLDEQKKIAAFGKALDDRITLLRETNATLEAIAQALFKSWFVDFDPVHANQLLSKGEGQPGSAPPPGGRRAVNGPNEPTTAPPAGLDETTAAFFPDSFEESALGLVPKGWRVGMLSDLADFQNGYAFKSKDWVESGHPVVKIGDVKPGIIDFKGCSYVNAATTSGLDRFKLNRGDLLVGMTGYVGETGMVPDVAPVAYLNQRVGRISTKSGLLDLGYVYCLVRNEAFKAYAETQSHGSAQANVSAAALLAYPSAIPSTEVLFQFNEVIHPLLEAILANHEKAQTLATLRDTLLPRLISGQLRLPEAEAMLEESP